MRSGEENGERQQTTIDPFRELNRYDERHVKYPSDAVFVPPRRTLRHGWQKFHATRDCGARNVVYVESTTRARSDVYEFDLRCVECGHRVEESEVLFVGGDWYSEHGWQTFGRPIEDLWLPEPRVLNLGPDPDQEALLDALTLGRIEREGSGLIGFGFGNGTWYECDVCESETPLTYDGRCRMCYDGPWTDRMQEDVAVLARLVRERNDSYRHRLPWALSPTSPSDAYPGAMLWRRHDAEETTKLVEVTQRLEDKDNGHVEYVLQDPTHTYRWQYHEDDLEACFWDTGLRNDEPKPVMDDRIREVYQQVCEHSFHTVHDRETHEPAGEKCINCRLRRDVADQ
jgi:hypothetical protein